jgi:glycosyltransferase involved in cell wall biosynthesis
MSNNRVSVIIPSRNEKFLLPTTLDILSKATGDIEVLIHLDGYRLPAEEYVKDDRVTYIHSGEVCGMRAGINKAAAIATGSLLTKVDGHHILSKGFDEVLLKHNKPKQVMIMRRKRLDADNWCEEITSKVDIDYEFLSCPESKDSQYDWGGPGLNGRPHNDRSRERKHILVDFNQSFQGSNWTMPAEYFAELGLMDEIKFGKFWSEAQEIGCSAYLTGNYVDGATADTISPIDNDLNGSVVTVKEAFAMHLHKGKKHGRMYTLSESWLKDGRNASMTLFKGEKLFKNQTKPLSWLIEFFWPVPTWTQKALDDLKERERLNGWAV